MSLANDIGAACAPYKNFMSPLCIDVQPAARPECLFTWVGIVWVGDGKLARQDQMSRQARVDVRWIVRVGPVGPRKDMLESPAAYLFFSLCARHVDPLLRVGGRR